MTQEVEELIADYLYHHPDLSNTQKAKDILALPEIFIKDKDQSLSKGLSARLNKPELSRYIYGKEVLDKEHWAKFIPKGEK